MQVLDKRPFPPRQAPGDQGDSRDPRYCLRAVRGTEELLQKSDPAPVPTVPAQRKVKVFRVPKRCGNLMGAGGSIRSFKNH